MRVRIRISVLGAAAAASLVACDPGEATLTDDERAAVTDTIVALMNGYAAALMSLDADTITGFYADDPAFRIYLDGQPIARDELVRQVSGMSSAIQSLEAAWEDIEVTPLTRDAALGASRFQRTVVDVAGDTLRDWGTATWVWVRRDRGWQLIHGHGVHYPGTLPS